MKGAIHQTLEAQSIAILTAYFGGGQSIRVPWTTANAAHLEVLIGMEQTARLVDEFGGSSVYLPIPAPRKHQGSKALPPSLEEVKRLSKSMTARQIAIQFGCSARSIYHKRARLKRRER